MTAAARPTAAQIDHLRAAVAGDLWVNGDGPFRRFVRMDRRVSGPVCERLYDAGWLRSEAQEGARAVFQCVPTTAGASALADHDRGSE